MLTREEAQEWARKVITDGCYEDRTKYHEKFGAGRIADDYWDDALFTFGMENGILIEVKKIFGELD